MNQATTERHIHDRFIEGCRHKDVKSQFALYQHYSKAMYNLCQRMLANPAEAEDALQEAFLEAFTKIESLRENRFFGAWLKKITINKCISLIKKRKIDWQSLDELKEKGLEDVVAAEALDRIQTATTEAEVPRLDPERVHREIKTLPDGCRTIFTLYQLEGYDHEEISEIMGLSVSTSKSQLHRARKLLQDKLKCMKHVDQN